MDKTEIVNRYWKILLTSGERPRSVFAFAEELEMTEGEFYKNFSSLKSIESEYWESTVGDTISVLEKDEDYGDYPVDQKLLAFFYTFITHAQHDRSRFVHFFPKVMTGDSESLKAMKKRFIPFMKQVVASGVAEGTFADRKKFTESYDQFLWMHLMAVIRFYIKDESEGFQDTDAFIEKSLKLGVESAAHGVLDSGLDFMRFMIGKDERLKGITKVLSKFIPEN